jgi:hypothetical protein
MDAARRSAAEEFREAAASKVRDRYGSLAAEIILSIPVPGDKEYA